MESIDSAQSGNSRRLSGYQRVPVHRWISISAVNRDIRSEKRQDVASPGRQSVTARPRRRHSPAERTKNDMYHARNRHYREQEGRKMASKTMITSSFRREESHPPIITEEQRNELKNVGSVRSKPDGASRDRPLK